jgi:hypothetical protein
MLRGRGGGVRISILKFGTGNRKCSGARACIPNKRISRFTTPTLRVVGAVQNALSVGRCVGEIFVLATCPSQFAKAGSAVTLPEQEKNSTVDAQQAE